MRRDDWIMLAVYAAGAALLSLLGPHLWQVGGGHAAMASAGAALCFAAAHGSWRRFTARRGSRAIGSAAAEAAEPAEASPQQRQQAHDGADDWTTRALRSRRIEVHLQPIVSLRDGRARHFEALTRLRGDNGVLHRPAAFLPRLSALGATAAFDNLQLAHVFDLCARLGTRAPETRIFANIAVESLGDADFRIGLLEHLRANPALSRRVILELEADKCRDLPLEARAMLASIETLGFELSLSGDELPSAAADLPGTIRKCRAELLLHLDASAIAELRLKGLTLIATHVEDERLGMRLAAKGLALAQGFAFGKPRAARPGRLAA